MTERSPQPAGTADALTDPIRQFLEAPRFATIATLDPNGDPHQAVIWYALDGDDLLINSRVGRVWPQNLDADPRVSIAVYDTERPYHCVMLKGRATRIHEGADAERDIMDLARRYGRDPSRYGGQQRATYRVRIEHAFDYAD
jgi:PPOX class probable F420-dependent enzyme